VRETLRVKPVEGLSVLFKELRTREGERWAVYALPSAPYIPISSTLPEFNKIGAVMDHQPPNVREIELITVLIFC
jgi:hypothetical protein